MEEILEMSKKEIERLKVLYEVKNKRLTQKLAAKKLRISDRQVRNLIKKININGDEGIISKKRKGLKNNCLNSELKTQALRLVKEYYDDFGPKLANEYLKEKHNIEISTETLRQWMIVNHLWFPRSKKKNFHLPRERRRAFGELIQVDGSHHNWFENRHPSCVLMVFIDDATSAITSLHFAKEESLTAYYQAFEKHLKAYGIPLAIYGDKCSVLMPRKIKHQEDSRLFYQEGTQFVKCLKELGCELILASSPQAKGRVERANRTLQDRLVKELRLRRISTIEDANAYLEEFRHKYNEIFSKKPTEHADAHRPLEGICLEHVLCHRENRTLSKENIVQFKNTFYKISPQDGQTRLFKNAKIEIRELLSGKKIALFKGKLLNMKPLGEVEVPLIDEKKILSWEPKKYIPPTSHPYKWKSFYEKTRKSLIKQVV